MTTAEKLDKLLDNTAAMKADHAYMKADLTTMREQLRSLDIHIIHGNGKPSLLQRVAVNENTIEDLVWWKRAVVGAFVTSLSGLGLAAINLLKNWA